MLKNFLKKIVYGAVGTALALNAGCTKTITTKNYLIDTETFKARPFAKLYGDLKVSQPVKEVSNVPESFRHVPIHHDDWWIPESNNGPIKDDSAKLPPLIEYSFLKGGLETKINEIGLDLYADLSLNMSYFLPTSHDPWFGEVNERNYMGAPGTERRGVGTALTYWTANYGPILIPGIKCDLIFPLNEDYELIIGGGISNYNLKAERGRDRYNKLEKKDDLKIADINEKSIYIGIRGSKDKSNEGGVCPIFKAGYNFYDYGHGKKDVKIDKNNESFFVSFGAEWLF